MRPQVAEALAALKGGDIERGVSLLESTVLSFGMKVCGHREDAEDTSQEVLLKLLPYLAKFDDPRAFSVWLYTVAKNRCLMSRRRSRFAPKEHLPLHELMPSEEEHAALTSAQSSPERSLLQKETSEQVRSALEVIPPQYRLILVLHDMEELSTAEIAAVTGLRDGTVRVRLHRARLALRKELARREHHVRSSAKHLPRSRNCTEIFAALSDFLDEALDPEMCDRLEKHFAGCPPCEAFLRDLERSVARCRAYDPGCKSNNYNQLRDAVRREYRRVLSALDKSASPRS